MRLPPYLLVRDSGFYFRIAIPHDLRAYFGKTEIRKSLATHDRHMALLKATALSANVRATFRSLRRKMADITDFNFDPNTIRELKIRNLKIGNTTIEEVEYDTSKPEEVKAFQQLVTDLGNIGVQEPRRPSPEDEAIAAVVDEVLRRKEDQKQAGQSQQTGPTPANMLSETYTKYVENRTLAGISASSLRDYRTAHKLLLEVLGDKPISHFSKDDANQFVETIAKLPPNRSKKPAYRGKPIQEVIVIRKKLEDIKNKELEEERKRNPKLPKVVVNYTMSVRTVDKIVACCSAFFSWALEKGHIFGNNVFFNMKIQSKSERERTTRHSRSPFSSSDLQKMFHHENYASRKTPHDFWIPLISLYSGARLNEIAQLYLTDIVHEENIWTFSINNLTPDKKLKNLTSERLVPVHPALIELGFLDFVEDIKRLGVERLFPHLPLRTNGYGRTTGDNFANYLRSLKLKTPEKTFHSFRHTFNNSLKQQCKIAEEPRSELLGHKHKGINANVYTETTRLPNKLEYMSKLEYQELDLATLKYIEGQFDDYMYKSMNMEPLPQNEAKQQKRAEALAKRKERYLLEGKELPASLRGS